MMFIAIKTKDGVIKGKLSFYCRMLGVSRQGFYKYLAIKDRPWKYQDLADAMRVIHAEDECNDTYGRIRMYQALLLKNPTGIKIPSERTVYRVMDEIGLIWLLLVPNVFRGEQTWYSNVFSYQHFVDSNLIPFRTIIMYIYCLKNGNINIDIPIKNVLANFFMFMPITILIKIKIPRLTLKKILLYIICFNLVIEILQFLTLQGSFDVDDILLRLFGAWISYAVYSSFRRKTFK